MSVWKFRDCQWIQYLILHHMWYKIIYDIILEVGDDKALLELWQESHFDNINKIVIIDIND